MPGQITITTDMQMTPPLWWKVRRKLNSLYVKVKKGTGKAGLKPNIQKTKFMASHPITSWQIDGETMTEFIWGGSKIIADGDCSHEIKRCLEEKLYFLPNLDSILKSRDITLSINVHLLKAIIFLIVMHGCESWTIEKAEC